MISWILLLVYILTSSVGMVLIKKGGIHTSFAISKEKVQVQISWVILFGIMLYLVSFVLWMYILQLFNLTYISPVAYGITYIFIMIFSYLLLNETIRKEQLVGVGFIIGGIFIASYRI